MRPERQVKRRPALHRWERREAHLDAQLLHHHHQGKPQAVPTSVLPPAYHLFLCLFSRLTVSRQRHKTLTGRSTALKGSWGFCWITSAPCWMCQQWTAAKGANHFSLLGNEKEKNGVTWDMSRHMIVKERVYPRPTGCWWFGGYIRCFWPNHLLGSI